ncbi:hypothetical protein MESS4_280032 [Mesorhizobium sp. STM 4661]|nr:hypothetical protein MESS4_280032 [Mesorhizobium sp. STM 4661]
MQRVRAVFSPYADAHVASLLLMGVSPVASCLSAPARIRALKILGTPKGNRTPVPAVRGRCPDR